MNSLPVEPAGKPKNTGVGSLSFLQQIFPTQESNRGLLHCRQILYQLSYQGSLYFNLKKPPPAGIISSISQMKKVRLRVIKQFAVCPTVSLEVGIQTERSHPISGKAGVLYLGGSAGTSGSVAARKLRVRWTLSHSG